jgi:hypothetical protein
MEERDGRHSTRRIATMAAVIGEVHIDQRPDATRCSRHPRRMRWRNSMVSLAHTPRMKSGADLTTTRPIPLGFGGGFGHVGPLFGMTVIAIARAMV